VRARSQAGQTTAEYLGVLVLVAAIVAAAVLVHPGRVIATGARAKVCDIARHPCGSVASGSTRRHGGGGVGGFLRGAAHGIGTGLGATGRALGGVGVGIYEGVKEPLVLGWKLSPQRAQLDPIGFLRDAKIFATGLGHGVTHPKELGKAALDWDTWAHDPARAVGHLIPNIALILATGGTGEAAETGEAVLTTEARAAAENEMRATLEEGARRAPGAIAKQAAERVVAAFVTLRDTAVFWSGLGPHGEDIAAEFAAKTGRTTLEQLVEARGLRLPRFNPSDPATVRAWEDASRAFAQGARGTVRVVLGDSVKPSSVWTTVERPTLEANPNVTRIIRVDPETGRETLLFTR
jgi:hypothetical protein